MPGLHVKRDYESWVLKTLKEGETKKYVNKSIISWGGAAIIKSNGDFEGIYSFGPENTAINSFLNNEEILEGLN